VVPSSAMTSTTRSARGVPDTRCQQVLRVVDERPAVGARSSQRLPRSCQLDPQDLGGADEDL
jgi:hypothetical protein